MKALLLCLLLAGCATAPDEQAAKCEQGGGCLTLLKTQLIQAMQKAWNDGYGKGYETGEDNAPPSCRRPA